MTHSTISLGLGLGGGKASTSSGRLPSGGGGGAFSNILSGSLDGTNEHFTVSSITLSGAKAVSLWVKFGAKIASGNGATLIANGLNDYFPYMAYGRYLYARGTNNSGTPNVVQFQDCGVGAFVEGEWGHVVISSDGTTMSYYFNGSLKGTDPNVDPQDMTLIGGRASFYHDSKLDEVALFDSALSASDVSAIYNNGVPADLTSYSPLHWWRFGDGTGDTDSGGGAPANGDTIGTVVDQGSGGKNATGQNGATFSNDAPLVLPSITNALSGSFDGTDDCLNIAASSDFEFGTNDFTISAWFYIDTLGNLYYPIWDFRATSSSASPSLYISQNNGYRFYAWNSVAKAAEYDSTPSVGRWHHVAYTRSGTTGTIYLNGSNVGSGTDNKDYDASTPSPALGKPASGTGSTAYLDGRVDEFSVFDSALSASNITAIYNDGIPNDISSLNPVGWWRMGDGTGDTNSGGGAPANGDTIGTVADQGSGGNNASPSGAPLYSDSIPNINRFSILSVNFDGSDDYMDVSDLVSGYSALSVSAWFKAETLSTFNVIASQYSSGGAFFLETVGTQVWFALSTGSSYGGAAKYTAGLDLNRWYHVCGTWDGTTSKIYVNGTVGGTTGSFSSTLGGSGITYKVGTMLSGYWNGQIDDVAVYSSGLSASDVTTLYNNGKPDAVSATNLVAWWRMGDGTEAGSGTTVYDMSSNTNNGTLTNGPIYTPDAP